MVNDKPVLRLNHKTLAGERKKFRLKEEQTKGKQKQLIEGATQKKVVKDITATWLEYFNEKNLNNVLATAVKSILHLLELPENPFINLSNLLRVSEHYHSLMHIENGDFELYNIDNKDAVTKVCQIRGYDNIWGVQELLQVLDPERVTRIIRRLNSYESVYTGGEITHGEYKLRYVDALIGPIVFHGRLIPYIPKVVTINQDSVVTGVKFEKAVAVFANHVISEVFALNEISNSLVIGVYVEKNTAANKQRKANPRAKKEDVFKVWSISKIKSSKSSFVSAVKAATISTRRIYIEFVLDLPELSEELDESDGEDDAEERGEDAGRDKGFRQNNMLQRQESGQFVHIKKTYAMHFRQADKEGNPTNVAIRSFTLFPFSSLCLGIFQNKSDAIFYAELFKTPEGDCWTMEHRKNYGPFRSFLKARMLELYVSGNLIGAIEQLTCLIVMAGRYSIIGDIQRVMKSSAGQLHGVNCWNYVLRLVLDQSRNTSSSLDRDGRRGFGNYRLVDKVVQQFRFYRKNVLDIVLVSDSSEVLSLRRTIRHSLYDMCDHVSSRLIIDEHSTSQNLQEVSFMCEALEWTISRDVVAVLATNAENEGRDTIDTIVGLIDDVMKTTFASQAKKVEATEPLKKGKRRKGDKPVKETEKKPNDDNIQNILSDAGRLCLEAFANEAKAAKRSRQYARCVSVPNAVKVAKKKRELPAEILREATLLDYVTQTRLDSVLHEVMLEVFTNGKLYPNPFPLIVGRFRAETLRHGMWRETDKEVLSLLSHGRKRSKVVSERNGLHKLVRNNIYGTSFALQCCNGLLIESIMVLLDCCGVICDTKGPNAAKGTENPETDSAKAKPTAKRALGAAYDATVCSSIGGSIALYSRIHPSFSTDSLSLLSTIPSITLFETHVYEGPRVQGALELFADYVISQILHMNDKTAESIVLCLATGCYAMDILNEDASFDGGWFPIHHHERHVQRRKTRVHTNTPVDGANQDVEEQVHSEEYFTDQRKRMYHPRYSHGEYIHIQKIRREKALCKQELVRAVKAKEPISVMIGVLVDPSNGDSTEESGFYVSVHKQIGFYYIQTPSGSVQSFVPEFSQLEPVYLSVFTDAEQAETALDTINAANDPETRGIHHRFPDVSDPHSEFYIRYIQSLKLRIAHNFSKGDILLVYRAMLRYAILTKRKDLLPDIIRILRENSICNQLDVLTHRSDVIRDLLEERFRCDESKRKIKAKVLKRTFVQHKQIVEDILARPLCVAFPGIRNAVHALLLKTGNAIDMDRIGNSTQHVECLKELHTLLGCVRVSTSLSYHRNCPHIDDICRNFAEELLPVSELAFI